MIPYKLPQERQTLLYYADLLGDQTAKQVLENDALHSKEEAEDFARFFWQMALTQAVYKRLSTHTLSHFVNYLIT